MGGLLSPMNAAWLAIGCMVVAIIFTALFLPESLSPAARRMVREDPTTLDYPSLDGSLSPRKCTVLSNRSGMAGLAW